MASSEQGGGGIEMPMGEGHNLQSHRASFHPLRDLVVPVNGTACRKIAPSLGKRAPSGALLLGRGPTGTMQARS
jgi:hypothetical protein